MAANDAALKVFISYARADGSTLAEDLKTGLDLAGFAPFLDRHDIAAGEDWERRLASLIEAADTVLFLVSPASVRSERCEWEVRKAEELSKRVLPVLAVDVPEVEVPEALRRRNYVKFTDGRSFVSHLRELSLALRENVEWIREHTRLGELASRWRLRQRPEELLLRGAELEAALVWLAQWTSPAPEPTAAHREFIGASEASEQERSSVERRRLEAMASAQADRARALQRARRWLVVSGGSLALLLGVTLVGGFQVLQLDAQVRAEQERVAQSRREVEVFRRRVEDLDRAVAAERERVEKARLSVAAAEQRTETFRREVLQLQSKVLRERENVELERTRVTEARRDVADFNQSVERLRAQIDGVVVRLEGSSDSGVANEMRAIGKQIEAARGRIRLSRRFTLDRLTESELAGRRAIENAPDPESFERLRQLALVLDRVVDVLGGCPIEIVSGYRGPGVSTFLKAAPNSAHALGNAVDIACKAFGSPYEVARAIERSPVMRDIDQLIFEGGRWVHIGIATEPRRQVFTTYLAPNGLVRVPRIENVDVSGRIVVP